MADIRNLITGEKHIPACLHSSTESNSESKQVFALFPSPWLCWPAVRELGVSDEKDSRTYHYGYLIIITVFLAMSFEKIKIIRFPVHLSKLLRENNKVKI